MGIDPYSNNALALGLYSIHNGFHYLHNGHMDLHNQQVDFAQGLGQEDLSIVPL
jgi:hypothetical protein